MNSKEILRNVRKYIAWHVEDAEISFHRGVVENNYPLIVYAGAVQKLMRELADILDGKQILSIEEAQKKWEERMMMREKERDENPDVQ